MDEEENHSYFKIKKEKWKQPELRDKTPTNCSVVVGKEKQWVVFIVQLSHEKVRKPKRENNLSSWKYHSLDSCSANYEM